MAIELRVWQFWSEVILVISNRTRAVLSFDFKITRMISDENCATRSSITIIKRVAIINRKVITITQIFEVVAFLGAFQQ